ncbi:MAG TPA: PAS domain S-box protein [Verrucomicrobiae bacterium]|nr:PAS domain S-box protein [Verrucomicrobiae bacterium]
MDLLLEKLWKFVAKDTSLTLQLRLFRLLCLTTAMVCLFVVLPVNLIEPDLPLIVTVADILLGLFAMFCHERSCKGRHHIVAFQLVLFFLLSVCWLANGGITGSVTYYFFAVMMMPMVLSQGRMRVVLTLLVALDMCGLFLVEYFFPKTVTHFPNHTDWFIDNLTGMFCSFLAIVLVLWVIVTSYEHERRELSRSTRNLATSEENYRGVVENAMSIILRLDIEGRITFFNKYAENLFGYTREEVIGRPAVGIIIPPVSTKGENLAAKLDDLLAHPEKYAQAENQNVCRDGRRIWVTWTNQPLYDEQGRLREILCVGADATERVALLEQLRLTQFTMDAAAEQIVWTNEDGRIIYANAATVAELGYSTGELLRLSLHHLATDFPADSWNDHWQALKRERSARFELTQLRNDGSTRPAELSVTYIKVADKEYTTVFIRDLTERRRGEERRREQEQQMQRLQRLESLGILAGGIAHDFNNLLTAILANISLVKLDLPPRSENHDLLGEAEKASLQAKGLTAQLLTFAKGGKPVKTAVNLEQIIRDSTSFALRGRPVTCALNLPADLSRVEAEAAQLSQVFNNLFINACQAMPEGGLLTVTACNRTIGQQPGAQPVTGGDYVEVIIRDQGMGIAPDHLAKIFDPYFTTKQTGSGLGLSVVHSIISNHQGSVRVDSRPGNGTTFTLLLPVSRQAPPVAPPVEIFAPAHRRRILIMDDEAMVCRVMSKMLGKLGYDVETAAHGEAAVQMYEQALAQKNAFDLLIMDLTIPGGMGGKEAIRRLKEIDPQVKAIVSSGYSNDPVMAEHMAHGFTGVVLKPYTRDQVQTAISAALGA